MDSNLARFNMVEQQVRPWEVPDQSVLDAMMLIARENFVPADYALLAFSDTRIPLGHGQAMLAPIWEGRLLQALAPSKTARVLQIGTGSGYLTALLGHLCQEVVSVDLFEDFVTAATRRLRIAGITNAKAVVGDGLDGWPAQGPYDVIAVTASSPARRPKIEAQLAPGGRLFMVVGTSPAMEALLITRLASGEIHSESLFELELEPLIGAQAAPRFEF
ncbi:MAG: protein-L-isoaspartate O-methyltransferase [Gammaproteobacteria bacterium]|nr:protein-L-isoaspartate O-methyltransferase [Gammaproteobacteria bacterium]